MLKSTDQAELVYKGTMRTELKILIGVRIGLRNTLVDREPLLLTFTKQIEKGQRVVGTILLCELYEAAET
mgnify:CR=1 FL=1